MQAEQEKHEAARLDREKERRHFDVLLARVERDVSGGGDPRQPPDPNTMPLDRVWAAVEKALRAAKPRPDAAILDEKRLSKLPSRWPGRREGRWEKAVDRLAVPAWDMASSHCVGEGVADTYSVERHPMYFAGNGILYCAPGRPTAAGTFSEWKLSYGSPHDVPGVWSPKWGESGPLDGRHEVAVGFAKLTARFELDLDL